MAGKPTIQVEMFEVGLGAALLLQFRLKDGKVVRVLADAGVLKKPTDRVLKKLPAALTAFHDTIDIDLIIGTHYDGDHLKGFPEIIRSGMFNIKAAWMPPVVLEGPKGSRALADGRDRPLFLVDQLAERSVIDVIREHVHPYLMSNRKQLEAENLILETKLKDFKTFTLSKDRELMANRDALMAFGEAQNLKELLGHFQEQVLEAEQLSAAISPHTDVVYGDDQPEEIPVDMEVIGRWNSNWLTEQMHIKDGGIQPLSYMQMVKTSATIRKTNASEAITAIHLAEVVDALKEKGIKAVSKYIKDGEPLHFVWKDGAFKEDDGKGELVATLLAPSAGLIDDLWDKIPVGTFFLLREKGVDKPIPLFTVTPNNRLSYVIRFELKEQGILVSGDAGCSDFQPTGSRAYHQALLDAMMPLHVVQVAHHGGQNHHFYRVLQAAGSCTTEYLSYWLLSHEVDDPKRPSEPFRLFVDSMRNGGAPMSLLFTSRPQRQYVEDFTDLFHGRFGYPAGQDRGDVRMVFDDDGWKVTHHAVEPPK
jgi:hypothetical protein